MQELLNKIHLGDCLEFMKQLPDKSIDLVLTDPPYGIGYDKSIATKGGEQYGNAATAKKHYHTSDWDNSIPDKKVFEQIQRISKAQIIFGGNYFAHILPASRGWLCWDKMTGANNFSDCELAWTSFDMPLRKIEFMWNGMLQGDMKNKEERIHPTQKPRQLFSMILEKYARGGGSAGLLFWLWNNGFSLSRFRA
jgi:site-specific DNA-methyltransferase (adenine-specific)